MIRLARLHYIRAQHSRRDVCKQLCVNLLAQGCQLSSFGYPIDHINVAVVVQQYRLLRHRDEGERRIWFSKKYSRNRLTFQFRTFRGIEIIIHRIHQRRYPYLPRGYLLLTRKKRRRERIVALYSVILEIYIYIFVFSYVDGAFFHYTEWNNVTWEFFLDSRAREASTRGRKIIYHASKHRCDSYPTPPFEPLTLLIACSLISRFNNFSRPFPCAAADNCGIHLHRFSRGCAFEGKLERGETKR